MVESFLAVGSVELITLVASLSRAARPILRPEEEPSIRVLGHLASAGRRGASQRETAKALELAEATVSRLCDQLEARQLIRRQPHPTDRRVKMLHITPEGTNHLRLCASSTYAGADAVLAEFSPAERDLLSRLLHRLQSERPRRAVCEGCRLGGC